MIGAALILLTLVLLIVYYVSQLKFDYWKKRKIPYIKPVPILGNYGPYIIQSKALPHMIQELCQQFPTEPYVGAFFGTEPTLLVQDPEFLKIVMTKDYYYFSSREISNYTHKEVFTQNLFFTYGDRWKVLRQNLTPLFSSSKMKKMFYLIDNCARSFETMLDKEVQNGSVEAVRPMIARFTMDGIGSCGFGMEVETLTKNSTNNPFTVIGELLFFDSYYRGLKLVLRSIWPALFYLLGMKTFPTEVDRFFDKVMKQVFQGRNYTPTNRHDFVDLILNLKKDNYITGDSLSNMKGTNKKLRLEVDHEFLLSQCVLFFAAGFETSSTTLHYTLYDLAKHPEAQQKVIDEVDEYLQRHHNKLNYDCVTELPYTEACIDETLRMYPVIATLTREVVEDYTLPCGAVIGKGVRIHIPVYHLHHNPDFFPEPEEYRPERFYGEEVKNIKPYTYLPFGEGPRLCIGMRFAKMQMFAGIVTIFKKYRVELAADTPVKLDITANTIVMQPKQLIKLKFVEREGWQNRKFAA